MLNEAKRWLVRRDVDANSTAAAGKMGKIEPIAVAILGITEAIQHGFVAGMAYASALSVVLWTVRCVAGWYDFRFLGWTKYARHYSSLRAPENVKIIRERKKKRATS